MAGNRDLPAAAEALDKLCRTYWYPLYAFVRRQGYTPEDAEDFTQQFFLRLLEKNTVAKADRDRGKFRSFLLGAMKNFLINEWKRLDRVKRGGDQKFISFDLHNTEARYADEKIDESNPADVYERQWADTLMAQVFAELRAEYARGDQSRVFAALQVFIWGDSDRPSYAMVGEQLKMTEGAVKVAVHRLRKRFREVLRAEVAHTVARPEDIEEELRHLIAALH